MRSLFDIARKRTLRVGLIKKTEYLENDWIDTEFIRSWEKRVISQDVLSHIQFFDGIKFFGG